MSVLCRPTGCVWPPLSWSLDLIYDWYSWRCTHKKVTLERHWDKGVCNTLFSLHEETAQTFQHNDINYMSMVHRRTCRPYSESTPSVADAMAWEMTCPPNTPLARVGTHSVLDWYKSTSRRWTSRAVLIWECSTSASIVLEPSMVGQKSASIRKVVLKKQVRITEAFQNSRMMSVTGEIGYLTCSYILFAI